MIYFFDLFKVILRINKIIHNSKNKIPRNIMIPGDKFVMYLQTTVGLEHLLDMYQHKRRNLHKRLR